MLRRITGHISSALDRRGALLILVALFGLLTVGWPDGSGTLAHSAGAIPPVPAERSLETAPAPANPNPQTLREAWATAQKAAGAWRPEARLLEVFSLPTPAHQIESSPAGIDGRRLSWQAIAASPGTPGIDLRITEVGAAVTSVVEVQPTSVAEASKPTIDSPTAISAALNWAGFKIDPRAGGYGFVGHSSQTGLPVIDVLGAQSGLPARVRIEGSTGSMVERDLYRVSSQLLNSDDAGQTWAVSTGFSTSDMITSIAAGKSIRSYAATSGPGGIHVWVTADGHGWQLTGTLPAEAGTRSYQIAAMPRTLGDELLLGTTSGVWRSADSGTTWGRIEGLPSGPSPWVALQQNVAAATVVDSAGTNLWISANGAGIWSQRSAGGFRVSDDVSGSIVAINEAEAGLSQRLTSAGSAPVTPPAHSLGLASVSAGRLLARTSSGVLASDDGGASWSPALTTSIASLAAKGPVVIAGGFAPGGLYRSADGGQTWATVSNDAQGDAIGSVVELQFVSGDLVLAVATAGSTWMKA